MSSDKLEPFKCQAQYHVDVDHDHCQQGVHRPTPPSPSRMREALNGARAVIVDLVEKLSTVAPQYDLSVLLLTRDIDAALSAPEQAGAGEPCGLCGKKNPNPRKPILDATSAQVADEGSEEDEDRQVEVEAAMKEDCECCLINARDTLAAEVRRLQAELASKVADVCNLGDNLKVVEADNARLRGFREECVKAVPWTQVHHLMAMLMRLGLVEMGWFETWHPELHARLTATKEGA